MTSKSIPVLLVLALLTITGRTAAAAVASDSLDAYRLQGVQRADPQRGKTLWYATDNERGCTSCHGDHPADSGAHIKTGKKIEPMAPSLNPSRLRSAKKIEKWFLRNCKWTFGRECSVQEKADILSWLANQ